MSGHGGRGRRGGGEHEEEEHENEERWLVSFADMMTLMFALFMVLFSISSVNTSKFESLKESLENSFDAGVTGGGQKVMQTGGTQSDERSSPRPPLPSMLPAASVKAALETPRESAARRTAASGETKSAAELEQEQFKKLKIKVDKEADRLGLGKQVSAQVRPRGLVIRLLTDGILFDSGRAVLKPGADKLLAPLGKLVRAEGDHPVVIEGYTDNVPIRSSQFPTNWELSGARAARVVRHFISDGVPIRRLSAMQYAQQHPLASNDTEQGRSKNRRVEIVLTRLNQTSTQGGETP